jgi:Tol biopolymer transport system component
VGAEHIPNPDANLRNSVGQYQWAGNGRIVFDTRWRPLAGEFGPGEYINADLWAVDTASGALTTLVPAGAAGFFSVSPAGDFVAISRPMSLDLINSDGSNYRPGLVSFPAILTYSEYAYKPLPVWSPDGTFFTALVPSADPMAAEASAAFYRVGTDGIAAPLGTLAGNFVFGGALRAVVSPSGQHVIYSTGPETSPGADRVWMARTDGSGSFLVHEAPVPVAGGWSPDGTQFAYGSLPDAAPGTGYLTGVTEASVTPFAPGLSALLELEWADAGTFYFIGRIDAGDWNLYRQALGAEPVLVASGLTMGASLDTR